jgi:hypothetical protein
MSSDEMEVFGQLTADIARLLLEADAALSADRWAIINNGSPRTRHRLYDAAALRHTCSLLRSIARAALDEDELAVRILSRAHVEAWLTGIYLHFGGNAAVEGVAADTRNETEITNAAISRYDKQYLAARRITATAVAEAATRLAQLATDDDLADDLLPTLEDINEQDGELTAAPSLPTPGSGAESEATQQQTAPRKLVRHWPARPKLRPIRQAFSGLSWAFAAVAGWRSGYFKVSGIAVPMSSKACRWALVGSASMDTVAVVPVNRTWLRVSVARCSSRPRKLR